MGQQKYRSDDQAYMKNAAHQNSYRTVSQDCQIYIGKKPGDTIQREPRSEFLFYGWDFLDPDVSFFGFGQQYELNGSNDRTDNT